MPKWYKDADRLWTPDFAAFTKWTGACQDIYGLFDGDKLVSCLYIEKQDAPHIIVIHMSMVVKIAAAVFVAKYSELRDQEFHRGVRIIRGWTLKRNFALVSLMTACGFRPSGLRMDYGSSHGRVMRWDLLEAVRG